MSNPKQDETLVKQIEALIAARAWSDARREIDLAKAGDANPLAMMRLEYLLNSAFREDGGIQARHDRVMTELASTACEGAGRLAGRVAIVTGAASGIGLATALLFAREGAAVIAADIDEAGLYALHEATRHFGERFDCIRTDVASDSSVKTMVEQVTKAYGRIDALVNNAGINQEGGVLALSLEQWERTIDTNLSSVYRVCHFAVPEMVRHGAGGSIVNMASMQGIAGFPNSSAYAASKGGIIALTRQLMRDFARYQIRVNSISPGVVKTPIFDRVDNKARIFELVGGYAPLGFVGLPEDIAFASLFLASDESRYVTGINMVVDGGTTARSL
jgi:3-oxoacyl-[acyl-carrier protein] reductase